MTLLAADPSLTAIALSQLVGSFAYHAYILAQNAALADYIPESHGLAVATARTMSMMGVSQVAGNVVGGYMTALGTRLPYIAGASCALAHAAVITFALRETNSRRLQAKVASVDVGEGGSNDSVSGGGGVRSVARVVLATVQRDPLAPLSSVKKLFISGKAVAWLSISVVAAEMIDRTHHLRVLVAFDRLGWVSRASCPTNPQLCFMIV